MDIETLIDRFFWLTSSLFPTIVFTIASIVVTYLVKGLEVSDKILMPILNPLPQYMVLGFWYFTGTIFACFILRKLASMHR